MVVHVKTLRTRIYRHAQSPLCILHAAMRLASCRSPRVSLLLQEQNFRDREETLKRKDIELQDSLIRFSKFLQDNDAKRVRALKKAADERKTREEKEREIVETVRAAHPLPLLTLLCRGCHQHTCSTLIVPHLLNLGLTRRVTTSAVLGLRRASTASARHAAPLHAVAVTCVINKPELAS